MPRRKVEYGTGLVVNPSGYVVTARNAVEGCHVVVISGPGAMPERLAEDKNNGLALLRVYGAQGPHHDPSARRRFGGDGVTLVGIADPQAQAGGDAVTTVPAKFGANASALSSRRRHPASPARPRSDEQGRLVGVAVHRSSAVAGSGAATLASLVPLSKIRTFLDAHYVAPAAGRPGIEGAKAATVRVICVRK